MRQLRAVPIALLLVAPLLAAGDAVSKIPEASPPTASEGRSKSDRAEALLEEANAAFAARAYPKALAAVEEAIALSGETEPLLELEWEILFQTGDWKKGLPVAVRLEEISKRKTVWGCLRIAEAHAMLGHETEALDWIEKAVRERSFMKVGVFEHRHYDSLRGNPRFAALVEEAKKNSGVGRVAADFSTHLVSGEEFSLSSLRGRVVLLDFWATWCAPCKKELPALQELYREFGPRGLEFVAYSLDEDRDVLEQYIRDKGLRWRVAWSGKGWDDETVAAWAVNQLPAKWLIGRDGRIRAFNPAGDELRRAVAELLAEPAA